MPKSFNNSVNLRWWVYESLLYYGYDFSIWNVFEIG